MKSPFAPPCRARKYAAYPLTSSPPTNASFSAGLPIFQTWDGFGTLVANVPLSMRAIMDSAWRWYQAGCPSGLSIRAANAARTAARFDEVAVMSRGRATSRSCVEMCPPSVRPPSSTASSTTVWPSWLTVLVTQLPTPHALRVLVAGWPGDEEREGAGLALDQVGRLGGPVAVPLLLPARAHRVASVAVQDRPGTAVALASDEHRDIRLDRRQSDSVEGEAQVRHPVVEGYEVRWAASVSVTSVTIRSCSHVV